MICYHHNDIDGKSAGYLVHKMHPQTIEDFPESYVKTTYGDKFDKHSKKDDVIIVDISISENTYNDFINVCKTARTVTWIDHHKTSLDVIKNHKSELQNISNLTYFVSDAACGAALTYCFFSIPRDELLSIRNKNEDEEYNIEASYRIENNEYAVIDVTTYKGSSSNSTYVSHNSIKLPKWLFYVDDYDCWKGISKSTNSFILGLDSRNTELVVNELGRESRLIFNPLYNYISDESNEGLKFLRKIADQGESIKNYLYTRHVKESSSMFEWGRFICKNATGNSWNFLDLLKTYQAGVLFNYDGKTGLWKYSVYSDDNSDFDCSEFCKRFGGGGHFHAAGFSSKELIFTSILKDE